jgi:hypothetical protein
VAAPPRRVRLDAVGGEARLHSPALPAFHARYQYCKRIFLSKVKLRAPRTMGATTDVLEDLPALYLNSVSAHALALSLSPAHSALRRRRRRRRARPCRFHLLLSLN